MKVTVKLFATLRSGRFEKKVFEYPDGTVVGQITVGLAFPKDEKIIIFINHRHAGIKQELKDGDVIAIFPTVGGG